MRISLVVKARVVIALLIVAGCRTAPAATATTLPPPPSQGSPPSAPPSRYMAFIGEYGVAPDTAIVLERDGHLVLWMSTIGSGLADSGGDTFTTSSGTPVTFIRDARGRVRSLGIQARMFVRRQLGPEDGNQLVVIPVRPIEELRQEAQAASPPVEAGPFVTPDLVELTTLDPTIKLEIRYATSNNLFGTPFYSQARAFMQRPAAQAVVRANATLRALGYGLLIHDGYRPWYVTKMFWEAAPVEKRIFVANPASGSKHNRGAAVDLTLYELSTGLPVEMPGTYDETTARSYADFPGGTSRQRWHRALLRRVMVEQRFLINPTEWWHFDFADWRSYSLGNVPFDQIR